LVLEVLPLLLPPLAARLPQRRRVLRPRHLVVLLIRLDLERLRAGSRGGIEGHPSESLGVNLDPTAGHRGRSADGEARLDAPLGVLERLLHLVRVAALGRRLVLRREQLGLLVHQPRLQLGVDV